MKIHGDKYDYSNIDYVNTKIPVIIGCPIHGDFEQTPDKHVNSKHGCPTCGGTKKMTSNEFIIKAKQAHGDTYNYVLVNYKTTVEKVQIVCHEHGVFKQTPRDHLKGKGCPKCGGRAPVTQKDFVMRSIKIHGNKYDYSLAKYVKRKNKVIIICPIHGKFKQTPNAHLNGHGCPECGITRGYAGFIFEENTELKHYPGRVYLVQFTDINNGTEFLKIGITKRTIKSRFSSGYGNYNYKILVDKEIELYKAFLLEQHILRAFASVRFKPKSPFEGRTECFTTQYKDEIIKTILTS